MQEYSYQGSGLNGPTSPNNRYSATKLEKHIALSSSRHHDNSAYLESIVFFTQDSSSVIQIEPIGLSILLKDNQVLTEIPQGCSETKKPE